MEPKSFVLLDLIQNSKDRKPFLLYLLLFYTPTIVGNLLIVVTVAISKTLNSLR